MTTPTDISYQCEIKNLETAVRNYCEQRDKLQCEVTALRAQLDQAHADGAVMRGAIKELLPFLHRCNDEDCPERKVKIQGEHALSTNAGLDLLARYREAVELVRAADPDWFGSVKKSMEWVNRRDTLLATVKGGSL